MCRAIRWQTKASAFIVHQKFLPVFLFFNWEIQKKDGRYLECDSVTLKHV